jgi:hypothetical protein
LTACSCIERRCDLLRFHDEPLWEHLLITTKVHPQFFAFRWITLLFTHEFEFPHQSLRLWDFILCAGDDHKLVPPPPPPDLPYACGVLGLVTVRQSL